MELTPETKRIAINFHNEVDRKRAKEMMPVWQSVGREFLDEGLHKKWNDFVKECAEGIGSGACLNETVMVLGLIKADTNPKIIKKIINGMKNNRTVISYLGEFVHPKVMHEIDSNISETDR